MEYRPSVIVQYLYPNIFPSHKLIFTVQTEKFFGHLFFTGTEGHCLLFSLQNMNIISDSILTEQQTTQQV